MTLEYWRGRFVEAGRMWGEQPSDITVHAADDFGRRGVRSVLVAGCGYGRNAVFLSKMGYEVRGVDFCPEALELADEFTAQQACDTCYTLADTLDLPFPDASFDGVFSVNLLHVLNARERPQALQEWRRVLRRGGVLCLAVLALGDPSCGQGAEVEENTFARPGHHSTHFFSEGELRGLLSEFNVEAITGLSEEESHADGERHIHRLLYAVATVE